MKMDINCGKSVDQIPGLKSLKSFIGGKIRDVVYLSQVAFLRTIYFNFKYFGIKGVLRLPILLSPKVDIVATKGKVRINENFRFGMIEIGFITTAFLDPNNSRTIWDQVGGEIIFKGTARIGHGTKFNVNGQLVIGDNFIISSETAIVCWKRIVFGDNCLLSWHNLIMDTDFHHIKDLEGNKLNNNDDIVFGNHVWVGCRCTILKRTRIGNNCIIGANSVLNKQIQGDHVVIAGNPGRVIRKGVTWDK